LGKARRQRRLPRRPLATPSATNADRQQNGGQRNGGQTPVGVKPLGDHSATGMPLKPAQVTPSPHTFTKNEAGETAAASCFSPAGVQTSSRSFIQIVYLITYCVRFSASPKIDPKSIACRLGIHAHVLGNAVSQPGNAVSHPGNADSQPGNADSQPGNAVSHPGNAVSQPGNVVSQPGNAVSQPGNVVSQPGNVVSQPGNVVSQPGNGVSELGIGKSALGFAESEGGLDVT
jgi:hypothetical protein